MLVAVVIVVAGLVGVGAATGWRTHAMTTPSMGTAAPVGTLVISRPARIASLRVGQIVVFHPPGEPGVTYAHRVHAITTGPAGPGVHTKGDINPAPDSWTLHQSNLVGVAVITVPDAGFAIQATPLLLLGAFVILLVTSGLARRHRSPARVLLGSILVAGVVAYLHPLERVDLLDQQVTGHNAVAVVVPTGILPLRAGSPGGTHTDIAPGQVGVVRLTHLRPHGAFRIDTAIHLTGWWWLVTLTWTIPILLAARGRRQPTAVSAVAGTSP